MGRLPSDTESLVSRDTNCVFHDCALPPEGMKMLQSKAEWVGSTAKMLSNREWAGDTSQIALQWGLDVVRAVHYGNSWPMEQRAATAGISCRRRGEGGEGLVTEWRRVLVCPALPCHMRVECGEQRASRPHAPFVVSRVPFPFAHKCRDGCDPSPLVPTAP